MDNELLNKKKFLATTNLERYGRIVFSKGNDYQFDELIRSDGRIYYRTNTVNGEVEIFERDIKRFFVPLHEPI